MKGCHPSNARTIEQWQDEFPTITAKKVRRRCTNQVYTILHLVCPKCNKPGWARPNCLRRQRRDGIPLGRCGSCARNKGGWVNLDGYRIVRHKGRNVPNARLVLAKKLGRPLKKREEAHHINMNRGDDRPENLEPKLKSNHGRGITPMDAVRWLKSIPGWVVYFSGVAK